jgi:sulfate-transporting ATPase
VIPMFVDQMREGLDDPSLSVFQAITDGADEIALGQRTVNSRAYCGFFNFKKTSQSKRVDMCSGGERNRLNLARTLKQGGNLLLLDGEPFRLLLSCRM